MFVWHMGLIVLSLLGENHFSVEEKCLPPYRILYAHQNLALSK